MNPSPSSSTLLTASNALSSLILRRQKQKPTQLGVHSSTRQTHLRTVSASSVKQNKRRRKSRQVLNDEEECERVKERKQEKVEVNVKVLKELSRRGKKEKEIIDEVPYTLWIL